MIGFKRALLVPGAVLAGLGLAACSRDAGTAPGATALREGSRMGGVVRDAFQPAGAWSRGQEVTTLPFNATVIGGLARLDSGGTVAATYTMPAEPRTRSFTDENGRAHEVVLQGSGNGPIRSLRHRIDGKPAIEASFEWDQRGGGWVLRERTIALYADGRLVAEARRTVSPDQTIASAGWRLPVRPSLAGFGSLLLPAGLEAQSLRCVGEWTMYGLASGVLSIAAIAFAASPNYLTYIALVGAIAAWEKTLDALIECEFKDM